MVETVEHVASDDRKTARLMALGGVLGAIGASTCCIVPLILFSLGVSGAWVGNLTALEPYKPIFIVFTLGFLGYGYWMVYRKPMQQRCCEAMTRLLLVFTPDVFQLVALRQKILFEEGGRINPRIKVGVDPKNISAADVSAD